VTIVVSDRAPDNELFDRGCDLVEAAAAEAARAVIRPSSSATSTVDPRPAAPSNLAASSSSTVA